MRPHQRERRKIADAKIFLNGLGLRVVDCRGVQASGGKAPIVAGKNTAVARSS